MKKITLILSLLSAYSLSSSYGQGLAPSSVRQIFGLQKGDSLEYHLWNVGTCVPHCDYYVLKTVDSIFYNSALDTLLVSFTTQILHFDSLGIPNSNDACGPCSEYFNYKDICPIARDQWTITYLDSTIAFAVDPTYHYDSVPQSYFLYDSNYIDAGVYNGQKQDSLVYGAGFDGSTDVYADSLGIVYKADGEEQASNNREQLIYFHKANGTTWGTTSYYTGVPSIYAGSDITIYPNPAGDQFTIHSEQYQGLRFELFDMLSEKVIAIDLSESETQVERNTLPSGIYFWQMANKTNVIKTGKLILE